MGLLVLTLSFNLLYTLHFLEMFSFLWLISLLLFSHTERGTDLDLDLGGSYMDT